MDEIPQRKHVNFVLITIRTPESGSIIVLVEAKYLSGKSSDADTGKLPMNQLAREWDNLE